MLLAIDIGNTNIVCGVFEGDKIAAKARLSTDHRKTADEYGSLLANILTLKPSSDDSDALHSITSIVLSSVVPSLTTVFRSVASMYFEIEPLVVGPGIKTELCIKYDDPRQVGADRIVNAVAATHLYPSPQIILDFGTALTFCAISRNKEYLGGAIFPGMHTAYSALTRGAALLSMIEFRGPVSAIGRATEESLQSGAINGYASVIEGMVARFRKILGEDAIVIGTGGIIETIVKITDIFDHIDPDLTLKGLKILHNINKAR